MASTNTFWGDAMADEIVARVERDPKLKALVAKHGYFIYDEKTPSGEIHIGSGRGWVIHDVLAKALRAKGHKARFVLSSDDFDPFDKPIKGKPEWNAFLGKPFRQLPSPVDGYESWADYYFQKVTNLFPAYGIDAELASTGEDYENGVFNDAIKKVLDNTAKVKKIFEEMYEKPYEKIPFNPICEECGRISTTVATAWDPEKELVSYECRPDVVTWAKGCGYKGRVSPYNGSGKLPWKVEWAAKWPSKGVIVELAGKDHFTKKGSRDVAIRVSAQVLEYPPPYPSTATRIGPGYEFFNLGGKKMSTSKGVGVGFAEITRHVPPKILRFLMVSYKPTSVIDFDPSRKNDLLLLYDRYDTAERVYYGVEETKRPELARIYEAAHVGPVPKELPPQVSLRHAGVIVQLAKDDVEGVTMLQSTGHAPKHLSESARAYLVERFAAARQWLAEFAPDSEKFVLCEKVDAAVVKSLDENILAAVRDLVVKLEGESFDEQSLFDAFYALCDAHGVKNTLFFKSVYQLLLNKERGPKLASLILSLGQARVAKLLKEV